MEGNKPGEPANGPVMNDPIIPALAEQASLFAAHPRFAMILDELRQGIHRHPNIQTDPDTESYGVAHELQLKGDKPFPGVGKPVDTVVTLIVTFKVQEKKAVLFAPNGRRLN